MKNKALVYRVKGEGDDSTHIRGRVSTMITLCGWVDVGCELLSSDTPITCQRCIDVVEYCKTLTFVPSRRVRKQ